MALVFISYATADSSRYKIPVVAEKLKEYQQIDEVLFWEEHMDDDIIKYMNDNLGRCDVLLVFCSPNAIRSESVEMEWMAALKMKKKLIPVFCKAEDIPPLLTTKLGVEYQKRNIGSTVEAIHKLILKKQKLAKEEEKFALQEAIAISSAQGTGASLEEVAHQVLSAIFKRCKYVVLGEKKYQVKQYQRSKLRYVYIEGYKFIEQNPEKPSRYGRMAREGKKIVWVLKDKNFYARLVEDEFVYL